MFYREAGDFSITYRGDSQTFPVAFDREDFRAVACLQRMAL